MKNRLFLALMFASIPAVPTAVADDLDITALRAEFRKTFPRISVDNIAPSPVPGMYEITSGQNIMYFTPSGNLIFGEIWSKEGLNLTAKRREVLAVEKGRESVARFRKEFSKGVTIGAGRHEIIEITDPDCPYCRRMHEYWETRGDVTRHVFFLPLTQIHPKSDAKVRFILSSRDQTAAFRDVYSGAYDQVAPPDGDDHGIAADHQALIAKSGISGTPGFFVDGIFVSGANVQAIEKIIGAAAAPAAKK